MVVKGISVWFLICISIIVSDRALFYGKNTYPYSLSIFKIVCGLLSCIQSCVCACVCVYVWFPKWHVSMVRRTKILPDYNTYSMQHKIIFKILRWCKADKTHIGNWVMPEWGESECTGQWKIREKYPAFSWMLELQTSLVTVVCSAEIK